MSRRFKIILGAVACSLVIFISVFSILINNQPAVQQPPENEFFVSDNLPEAQKTPVETALSNTSGTSPTGEMMQLKSIVLVEVYKPVGDTMVKVFEHESSNVIVTADQRRPVRKQN